MLLSLLFLAGCTTETPEPTPVEAEPAAAPAPAPAGIDVGWVGDVAQNPANFADLLAEGREGWIALHANDPMRAWEAFPEGSEGRTRAAFTLAVLHADLARLSARTWAQLGDSYLGRQGIPAEATQLFARASSCDTATDPLNTDPIVSVEDGDFTRQWYDPCTHAKLASQWSDRAFGEQEWHTLSPTDGLSGSLFAPWLDSKGYVADRERVPLPGLVGLGTFPALQNQLPGVDGARQTVRLLDVLISERRAALEARGDEEGLTVLRDLAMFDRFRQEWLLVQARRDLLDNQPMRALATLELALDVTEREVGSENSLSLFALLAEANLASGRTREALDALERLSAPLPTSLGLRETVGDLAVLKGLDRTGDSKEH